MSIKSGFRWLIRIGVRLALLLIGGLLMATLGILYGESSDSPWLPSGRWLALAAYSALVLGTLIEEFRRSWNRMTFWLSLAVFFTIHSICYAIALVTIDEWRAIWFLPISIAEVPLLTVILVRFGYDHKPVRSGRTASRTPMRTDD